MAWEYQDRDMSVLYIFSSKPGIPNPPAFQAGQDIILAGRKDCLLHIVLIFWDPYYTLF